MDGKTKTDTEIGQWRIEMLGSLQGRRREQVIDRFQTQKTGALLAFLSCHLDRRHTREALVDLLWPDADLNSGRARLSQALSWLRVRLEPTPLDQGKIVQADRLHVGLIPMSFTSDVAEFDALIRAAERPEVIDAQVTLLESAVSLYRGELLPGHYEDWVLIERQRLFSAFIQVLRRLALSYESLHDHTRSLKYAQQALLADPAEEELHALVIRLLAAGGQRASALRQFRTLEKMLHEEFGQKPSAATRELLTPPLAVSSAPPTHRSTIPMPLTRFFGREAELQILERMLTEENARLVTITGVGGSGKTRLAIETALRIQPHFQGAVWFISLGEISDSSRLFSTVVEAMYLSPADSTPLETVVAALSQQPSLLVLDNMEHLLTAAPAVGDLLKRLPLLTILTTSRRCLRLQSEREFSIPPLATPASDAAPEHLLDFPCVQLFVDRAQATQSTFALTEKNARALAKLSARLEGIPLAIELCAAWAHTISPQQMLKRLDHRFELLVSHRIDVSPRQRTLLATLEDSFLQLPQDLHPIFLGLSVFRGGWTLEAVEGICRVLGGGVPTIDALTELRERSLIATEEPGEGRGEAMRYYMLETVREFAAQQLTYADEAAWHRAHAEYLLGLAEAVFSQGAGSDHAEGLAQLDEEHENLRAALAWALELHKVETGLRLCVALKPFWHTRGFLREGDGWLRHFLEQADAPNLNAVPTALRAAALSAVGHLTWLRGDYSAARGFHEVALALCRQADQASGVAESLFHIGITAYRQADYAAAQAAIDESLRIARALSDQPAVARALLNQGNIANVSGDLLRAQDLWEQCLTAQRALGNRQGAASVLNNLGVLARCQQRYIQAVRLFEEALELSHELKDNYGVAVTLANLGGAIRPLGDLVRARSLLTAGLRVADDVGNRHLIADYFLQFGHLALDSGDLRQSVVLTSVGLRQCELLLAALEPADVAESESVLSAARAGLPPDQFADAWEAGRMARPEKIIADILSQVASG